MISLPPLANLLAIREEDPEALAEFARDVRSIGEFGKASNGQMLGSWELPTEVPRTVG